MTRTGMRPVTRETRAYFAPGDRVIHPIFGNAA